MTQQQRKFLLAWFFCASAWVGASAGCSQSEPENTSPVISGGTGAGGSGGSTTTGGAGNRSGGGTTSTPPAGGTSTVIPTPDDPLVAFDGPVRLSTEQAEFRHVEHTLAADGSLANVGAQIVSSMFEAMTIENDLVRVVVVPEYGGRILSIVYKPTQQELLYQNSVGTPFGVDSDAFYYKWLMVYGGIFPSFPEPEHGKMWFLPWQAAVITQTDDEVAIRMSRSDDLSPSGAVPPERFRYGRTDLAVSATVRVRRGSAAVAFDIEVANTRPDPVEYEYWTCTTLAPGSVPGQSEVPRNTEMVTPIERVYLPSNWEWMAGVEEPAGAENVYYYDRLADFANWQNMGIAYAEPAVEERWWGAVNHDAGVGVFRVADNATVTPGLKFWTWGADSVDHDREAPTDRRPYIELWAGHSSRFFQSAWLGANERKQWTETYLPTLALSQFTDVNETAAAHLSFDSSAASTNFRAEAFTAVPSRQYRVRLTLETTPAITLREQDWLPDATSSTLFEVSVPSAELPSGTSQYSLVIQTAAGREVYRASTEFSR